MKLSKNGVDRAILADGWKQLHFGDGSVLERGDGFYLLRDKGIPKHLRAIMAEVKKRVPFCSHCLQAEAVQAEVDGYLTCEACHKDLTRYYTCHHCGKAHDVHVANSSRKRFETLSCWEAACRVKEDIRHKRLCCELGERIPCVCVASYRCPVHAPNGMHIGSHD